ncbi:Leucine-rich_repeat domain superfamily [Hexamita inflata]|uniref:Leucine-rich repeat domain superfamily n=1 Tax=Hexamita inflata TaxID=28002 RepID=A0AA86RFX7_9EUKA|nr:Leucine-rich repeat domain superfamily [Hexamita inflata]
MRPRRVLKMKSSEKTSEFRFQEFCKAIQYFYIHCSRDGQNNIECASVLSNFQQLVSLDLSENLITNISYLRDLLKLQILDVSFEPIAKHKFANKNWVREQRVPTETDFMNSFGCSQYEVTQLINKSKQQKEMSDNKYMLIKKYENDVKNSSLKINGEQKLNNLQFTDVLKLTELACSKTLTKA